MNPTTPTSGVRLTIELDTSTGMLHVDGPIDNQMLCYGLLEMAKDAVRNHAVQNQRRIQPVNGVLTLPKIQPS